MRAIRHRRCTTTIQFLLLPRHTTSTNIRRLFLHLSIHLPLPLSNDIHPNFNRCITPRTLSYHAKIISGRPKSHHRQSRPTTKPIHRRRCRASLGFHRPLHHTTLTNTGRLSVHAHSPQSDDLSPHRLPSINATVLMGNRTPKTSARGYHHLEWLPQLDAGAADRRCHPTSCHCLWLPYSARKRNGGARRRKMWASGLLMTLTMGMVWPIWHG